MKFELHIQSVNAVPSHELARILGNIAGRLERERQHGRLLGVKTMTTYMYTLAFRDGRKFVTGPHETLAQALRALREADLTHAALHALKREPINPKPKKETRP